MHLHPSIATICQESSHANHDVIERREPFGKLLTQLRLVSALGQLGEKIGAVRHGADGELQ
jgi:hypothetical protein